MNTQSANQPQRPDQAPPKEEVRANAGRNSANEIASRSPKIGDKWSLGLSIEVQIVDISETRVWLVHHEPGQVPKYSSREITKWDEALTKTLAIEGVEFIPANAAETKTGMCNSTLLDI